MPIPYLSTNGQSNQMLLSTTILSNREHHYQYPFEKMQNRQQLTCYDYLSYRDQSLNQMTTVKLDLLLDDLIDNITSYYDDNKIDFNDFNLKIYWNKEDSIKVKVNSIEKLQPKFYLD